MAQTLTEQIQQAMRKAGIDVQLWTHEQAERALGHYAPEWNRQVDARFDKQILVHLNGALSQDYIYQMGVPSQAWLSAGIPNVPIEMKAVKMEAAFQQFDAPRDRSVLLGLTESMRQPMAIFRHDNKKDEQVMLVAFYHQDKPMMLLVHVDYKDAKHPQVEINNLIPLHKGEEIVWLSMLEQQHQNLYIDKQRMHQLIGHFRKEKPENRTVRYAEVTEIVSKFQNPQFYRQIQMAGTGFYSNARHAVENIQQGKATPAQWLAMIQKNGGIKAGEDKWLGLSDWLKESTEKALNKADVLDYIDNHCLQLKESKYVWLESYPGFKALQNEFHQLAYENMSKNESSSQCDDYHEAYEQMIDKYGYEFQDAFDWEHKDLYIKDEWEAGIFFDVNAIQEMRLKHTTEGLDNYHEIALYFENIKPWNEDDEIHFGEVAGGRCVAWIRFGEKMVNRMPTVQEKWDLRKQWPGPEGWVKDGSVWWPGKDYPQGDKAYIKEGESGFQLNNFTRLGGGVWHDTLEEAVDEYISQQVSKPLLYKILLIDEIQSNRHQDGREKGYRNEKDFIEAKEEYRLAQEMVKNFTKAMEKKYEKEWWKELNVGDLTEEEKEEYRFLNSQATAKLNASMTLEAMPPVAPLEKNWHEVCMKRMLQYAAENGYGRLAWITGEQQARRYQIGTYLTSLNSWPMRNDIKYDSLEKDRIEGYEVVVETSAGQEILIQSDTKGYVYRSGVGGFERRMLSDIIGKSLATKVLQSESKISLSSSEVNYMMEIGGMRTFYNEILPQFMNRYGKKWGAQVKQMEIPVLGELHVVDIPEAMKRFVLEGQPMFMFGKQGQVLGLTLKDTVYLTPEGMNPETLVHEYTHVWATAMQHGNPEGWQSVKQLLKDSPVWGEIYRNPLYTDLRSNEDALASEVLAHISGRSGAEKLETMYASKTQDTLSAVRMALDKFWSWVGKHLFDIERLSSIEEVTDRVLFDLVNSTPLEAGKPLMQAPDHGRLSHITVFEGKGGVSHIRCKIDGVQQMGKPLKHMDSVMARHPDNLLTIAHSYFRKELEDSLQQKPAMHR